MNSLDRDLLDQAADLTEDILNQLDTVGVINPATIVKATAWLARAAAAGVKPPRAGWGQANVGSRWRDIAAEPTPDPPDDPDEGETGPPEQQG